MVRVVLLYVYIYLARVMGYGREVQGHVGTKEDDKKGQKKKEIQIQ